MQSRQVATVRFLSLSALDRIEESGHFGPLQYLELGHLRCVQAPRVGNRGFLLVCGRSLGGRAAVGILLTHSLHGELHGALRLVVVHGISV